MATFNERLEHKVEVSAPLYIIHCRTATIIEKDGVDIATSYHRDTYAPGYDLSDACDEVKKVAAALWTPAVIAAYEASLEVVDAAAE